MADPMNNENVDMTAAAEPLPELQPLPLNAEALSAGWVKWLPLAAICVGIFAISASIPRVTTGVGRYLTAMVHPGVTRSPSVNRGLSPALKYPDAMLAAHLGGAARVKCMVDAQGHSHGCHIVDGANAMFNRTALDFVTRAIYDPALRNGVPVAAEYTIWVNFVMP